MAIAFIGCCPPPGGRFLFRGRCLSRTLGKERSIYCYMLLKQSAILEMTDEFWRISFGVTCPSSLGWGWFSRSRIAGGSG